MSTTGTPASQPLSGKSPPGRRRERRSARTHRPGEQAAVVVAASADGAAVPARERDERQQREARILDAAATLLVRWGFRKTTIDDVAREAGVGKGTIYLHWRDKNELFRAAIWREFDRLSADIMRRVNDDPQGGLPHRLWTLGMLATLESPLISAIMKGQVDIFQGLLDGMDQQTRDRISGNAGDYVAQIQRAGLIRTDLEPGVIAYVMSALKIGLIHAPDFTGGEHAPSLEVQTEAISDLLRRWLEPEALPTETDEGKHLLGDLLVNFRDIAEQRGDKGEHE